MTHPVPLPLPAPIPWYFRFFDPFMDAFLYLFISYSIFICIYMITTTEYKFFDRFFGVKIPAQRGLMYYHLGLEPGPLKASKYSYTHPDTWVGIPHNRYAVGRPCGSILQACN